MRIKRLAIDVLLWALLLGAAIPLGHLINSCTGYDVDCECKP